MAQLSEIYDGFSGRARWAFSSFVSCCIKYSFIPCLSYFLSLGRVREVLQGASSTSIPTRNLHKLLRGGTMFILASTYFQSLWKPALVSYVSCPVVVFCVFASSWVLKLSSDLWIWLVFKIGHKGIKKAKYVNNGSIEYMLIKNRLNIPPTKMSDN